ncbi:MAG TPA: hypothetical protein DCR11_01235 [Deltaproteobacteria bacterium]|nr:hypothetical protein [Deltaproteobacteria bacterium]
MARPLTHIDVKGDGNSFIFALNKARARYVKITQDCRVASNFHPIYEIFIYRAEDSMKMQNILRF